MHDVLTLKEAAAFLRCSPDTVKRRARAGQLPASKIGRQWRFRRRDLDTWLGAGGLLRQRIEDAGLLAEMEAAKAEVANGRERLVSWEEAKAGLVG
jgi:excisionase family DNA binding protein